MFEGTAVSLMTLAFVEAGIMSMESAMGVVFGTNIGTTITGWIIATIGFKLDIVSLALPLIAIGSLELILFSKSARYSSVNRFLVGFGFLFAVRDLLLNSQELQRFESIQEITEEG
ncbi:MAG TPA: hypothetical protein VI603_02750 [Saprospiraceae bacterium]|nr:hypothetical protein [Saprospiraceae bacterium]